MRSYRFISLSALLTVGMLALAALSFAQGHGPRDTAATANPFLPWLSALDMVKKSLLFLALVGTSGGVGFAGAGVIFKKHLGLATPAIAAKKGIVSWWGFGVVALVVEIAILYVAVSALVPAVPVAQGGGSMGGGASNNGATTGASTSGSSTTGGTIE